MIGDIDSLLNDNYFIKPEEQKQIVGNSYEPIQLSPAISGNTGISNIVSTTQGMDFVPANKPTFDSVTNPYDLSKAKIGIDIGSDTPDTLINTLKDNKYENKVFTVESIKELGKYVPVDFVKGNQNGGSNGSSDNSNYTNEFQIQDNSPLKKYEESIRKNAKEFNIRPEVLAALLYKENTNANPNIATQGDQVDGSPSFGLGQMGKVALIDTNKYLKTNYTMEQLRQNPDLQIKLSAAYLKTRIDFNNGNEELGIKNYNGDGDKAVQYAKSVLSLTGNFLKQKPNSNSNIVFPMTGNYNITSTHLKPYRQNGVGLDGINIGTDYAPKQGEISNALAWGDSEVYKIKSPETSGGSGNLVILKSNKDGKDIYTYYEHLANINVKAGDKIKAGTSIGTVGNTGERSTGTHLSLRLSYADDAHVFYKQGVTDTSNWIDPEDFFKNAKQNN